MSIAELRAAVTTAFAAMERALTELESVDVSDEDAVIERTTQFEVAKTAHERAVKAVERKEALAEARAALPVAPAEDTPDAARSVVVTERSLTYSKPRERGTPTIFADMAAAQFNHDAGAIERIQRHGKEMADATNPLVGERALNTTDTTGGEFVAPIYLQDQWIGLPRARRPVADLLNAVDLPPNTDTINIPKIGTGTAVEVQTDGGAVQSTDLADTHITAAVQTVAGQQDVSQQLVDLSAPGIDLVIWDDITRAYDSKIDFKVLNGTVTNAKGILQVAGVNSRTYVDATPTVAELYPKTAAAIADVHTNVFVSPDAWVMHPLRWAWLLAAVDSTGRPLVVPSNAPGFNAAAIASRVAAESVVGSLQGVPVIVDAQVPVTLGAGTEDIIAVVRSDEVRFWESPTPRLRVFGEVLSGTLQVRFQLYNYYAIMAGRLPKCITTISGTGLIAPTF